MKSIPHRHDWDAGTVRNPAYQARHQGEPVQKVISTIQTRIAMTRIFGECH